MESPTLHRQFVAVSPVPLLWGVRLVLSFIASLSFGEINVEDNVETPIFFRFDNVMVLSNDIISKLSRYDIQRH